MVTLGLKFDYEISKTRAFIKFASSPAEGPATLASMQTTFAKTNRKDRCEKSREDRHRIPMHLSQAQEIH
jgi:hypothetical protein